MNQPIFSPFLIPSQTAALMQREVKGGDYDFESNLLVLEVEVTEQNAFGETQKRIEKRYFEVASLRIGYDENGKKASPLEIIGARTKEVMQKVMPQIIKNIQKNVNLDTLFSNPSRNFTRKTLRFKQNPSQAPQPNTMPLSSNGIEFENSELFFDVSNSRWGLKNTSQNFQSVIKDLDVFNTLFNYSEWKSAIHTVETTQKRDHLFNVPSIVTLAPSPYLKEITQAIQKLDRSLFGQRFALLNSKKDVFKQFEKDLNDRLDNLNDYYKFNKGHFTATAEFSVRAMLDSIRGELIKVEAILSDIENALLLHQDFTVLDSLRSVLIKDGSLGEAPIGSTLARDWNLLVKRHQLLLSDYENIRENQKELALQNHISSKFGFAINFIDCSASLNKFDSEVQLLLEKIDNDRRDAERRQREAEREAKARALAKERRLKAKRKAQEEREAFNEFRQMNYSRNEADRYMELHANPLKGPGVDASPFDFFESKRGKRSRKDLTNCLEMTSMSHEKQTQGQNSSDVGIALPASVIEDSNDFERVRALSFISDSTSQSLSISSRSSRTSESLDFSDLDSSDGESSVDFGKGNEERLRKIYRKASHILSNETDTDSDD